MISFGCSINSLIFHDSHHRKVLGRHGTLSLNFLQINLVLIWKIWWLCAPIDSRTSASCKNQIWVIIHFVHCHCPCYYIVVMSGLAMVVQNHAWPPFKSKNSSVRNILQTTFHHSHPMEIWLNIIESNLRRPCTCCYDTRACYGSSKAHVISPQVQNLTCKENLQKQPPSNTSDEFMAQYHQK